MRTLASAALVTDALLFQATLADGDSSSLPALLEHLRIAVSPMPVRLQPALSLDKKVLYVYLHFEHRTVIEQAWLHKLEAALQTQEAYLENVRVSRLEKVFAPPCASADEMPAFHYVVEMDPAAGHMPELAQWYDTEHMPGLAQVPGCVHAARFLNHDHGPLSLACYDLVDQETLGSPPWLAVRNTNWSSRMRPHFTNTVRTMFTPIAG
jgi:hypothetical protein